MRRGLAAVVLGLGVVGLASAASPAPSLRLVTRQPVAVQGAHFRAFEAVTLTVTALPPQVKRVKASRRGSFAVAFDKPVVRRCGSFAIRAVGARGSVAMLKLPLPAC